MTPDGAQVKRFGRRVAGSIPASFRRTWFAGLDLLFPPRCVVCEGDLNPETADPLCEGCRDDLIGVAAPTCVRCGSRVPDAFDSKAGCQLCRQRPPRFSRVALLGSYQGALRSAVLRMKQQQHAPLAAALARLLWTSRADELRSWRADVVAPVPMHWLRRIARGVNSPDIIAEHLARELRLPCAPRLLRRRRNTADQGDLSRGARLANVRGAFALSAGCDVRGSRVLLVDDVLTTAATSNECARTLLRAGATEISLAVLARAESGGTV
jgi:ComF family protein